MEFSKILVRATNWVGDAVMSLPAMRELRARFPKAEIVILARPWVADLYGREPFCDRLIEYKFRSGIRDWSGKLAIAQSLKQEKFECAILFQNAFEAALVTRMAAIPKRIGYARDGRSILLTHPVPVPRPGEIPNHERFYYLELLRRAKLIDRLPDSPEIRLEGAGEARAQGLDRFRSLGLGDIVVGVSPGAAYGSAKRWLPERFAEAASRIAAEIGAAVAIFGSKDERPLCDSVLRSTRARAHNFAGETSLREFIDLAAACRVFLTNDSGAMHIASAAGVPTVAVFGSTDHVATGPSGEFARIVREPVECSPCLKRECPIDHRCMTRVDAARVAQVALELVK